MQILDNRNWEFPMGFTSRLIRKPTAGGVRLFRESWKGQRSAINKRVPIWFVLNYITDSCSRPRHIIKTTTRSEYTMSYGGGGRGGVSGHIMIKLQDAEMHTLCG